MTDKAFLTNLTANLAELGDITVRPMMGEYLLYLNGKYTACICDNTVFVKLNKCNAELVANLQQKPPYDGAKPAYIVPVDDVSFLRNTVRQTYLGTPDKKKK